LYCVLLFCHCKHKDNSCLLLLHMYECPGTHTHTHIHTCIHTQIHTTNASSSLSLFRLHSAQMSRRLFCCCCWHRRLIRKPNANFPPVFSILYEKRPKAQQTHNTGRCRRRRWLRRRHRLPANLLCIKLVSQCEPKSIYQDTRILLSKFKEILSSPRSWPKHLWPCLWANSQSVGQLTLLLCCCVFCLCENKAAESKQKTQFPTTTKAERISHRHLGWVVSGKWDGVCRYMYYWLRLRET